MVDTPESTPKSSLKSVIGGVTRSLGEMKEAINPYPVVFSGDTLENFLDCAILTGREVMYRKIASQRRHKETYFEGESMDTSLERAITNAQQLQHTPIIMEARLFLPGRTLKGMKTFRGPNGKSWYSLPEGTAFTVRQVWVPKEGFDWNDIDTRDWNKRSKEYKDAIKQGFQPVSPITLVASKNP